MNDDSRLGWAYRRACHGLTCVVVAGSLACGGTLAEDSEPDAGAPACLPRVQRERCWQVSGWTYDTTANCTRPIDDVGVCGASPLTDDIACRRRDCDGVLVMGSSSVLRGEPGWSPCTETLEAAFYDATQCD